MANKTNDWVAAQLNAPIGVDVSDFYANGITPENTGIHDRDYYKNIPQVQEQFSRDGKFDDSAYNQFYDSALRTYNDFSNDKFLDDYVKNAARHQYDWFNIGAPVLDTSVIMLSASDKNRHSQGLSNIWQKGDPTFSDREIAQANFVRDENGNVLDWTPNEGGLFKNIFGPSLALAIWEEDGEHMENGMMVQHSKGDLKLDENGDPYTEILGNKESYGRDIVKWSDVLTEDGSWWNKIDPFDSDGFEKGIGKTIAETALKVAPYFIPYVGPYLGALSATMGLASVMPTLGKAISGIVSDNDKTVFGQTMTKWENVMQRFGDSTSDAGRKGFWNAENIGNIISSSFSQLASQKFVGKIPKLLNPNTKNTELGRQLALGYMAVTSAQDSYSAFKEAGANDTTAGLGMLATMGAMYGLMNVDYFKKWLFRDTWLDEEIEFRKSFKDFVKKYADDAFGTEVPVKIDPNTFLGRMQGTGIYKKVYSPVKDFVKKYIKEGKYLGGSVVANRMLNEGLEETSEEAMTDVVKALALGAQALGLNVTEDPTTKLDFGYSLKDIASRYSAAFFGGAIGGGVFEGFNNWENFVMGTTSKISDIKDLDERMIWYQRNGYHDRMLQTLEDYRKKHKLPANNKLSASKFEIVDSTEATEEGYKKRVYLEADGDDNQETALYNILRTRIETMKNILDEHIILMSDKETVKNVFHQKGIDAIESEAKKQGMTSKELMKKGFYDEEIEALRAAGLLNDVIADVQSLSLQIFQLGVKLRNAKSELSIATDENKATKTKAVKNLEEHLKLLTDQYQDLVSGKNAGKYIAHAWYTVNGPMMSGYLNQNGDGSTYFPQTNIRHFVKWKYNLNYDELSESHKELIQEEFNTFTNKDREGEHLRQIRDLHYTLTSRFSKDIEKIKNAYKGYKSDPYHENDLFLNVEMRDQNLVLLNRSITALENKQQKKELDNEELLQLESFKHQRDLLENDERLIEFQSSLSEKGEKELGKWINSTKLFDSERIAYREFIKNFYTKLANERIISPYEGMLFHRYLESETAPIKTWDFKTTAYKIKDAILQQEGEAGTIDVSYQIFIDPNVLGRKANSFWEELSTNPKNARNVYNSLIEDVKTNSKLGRVSAENVVNVLLGTNSNFLDKEYVPPFNDMLATISIDIVGLLDFIDEINSIRQNIKKSSVHELLSELSFIVHGRELEPLEILKKETADLNKNTNLSDYVIDNDSLEELKAAKHVVQMAMSLIQTAADGTNAKINKYQDEQFATIDLSQNNLFIRDLSLIYDQISKLIELAENNEQSLIDEQQDIAINMLPKMIKSIVNPSIDDNDEKLISSAISEMGIDIKSLWEEYDLDNVDSNNYKELYSRYLKFASALRSAYLEAIKNYGGNREFGQKLASKISGLNFKSTKFTSKPDEQVTAFDSLVFFLTLAGADTSEFESKFKTVCAKESKLLPYFAQEFAVHCAWARIHNNDLFDGFIDGLKINGSDKSKYVDNMTKLSRFTIVDGSGGTGKSTGVAKFLWGILKDEGYDILVVSNDRDRATALKETLGVGDEVVKTTAQTLKDILGKDYQLSNFVEKSVEGHYALSQTDLSDDTIKKAKPFVDNSKKKKLMVIDEITLLDEMELQILSEYAKFSADNISILGLGDSKQNAKKVTLGSETKTSGIEDCVYVKTPALTASLRKTCRGKKVNLNVIGTVISALNDWYLDNLGSDDNILSKQTQSIINAFAEDGTIDLAYTINENGLFGETFDENPKSRVEELITYLKEGEKLAILVDDAGHAEYSDIKTKYGDKVEVLNSAQIQGGQFKYVIVDKTFDSDPDNKRATLKDFYTAISRSTTGTIIGTKKSDIRKIFDNKISQIERHDAAALIVNPDDERYNKIAQKYRDWRMDLFSLVSTSEVKPEEKELTPSPTSTPTPEPQSLVVSDPVSFDEIKKKISQPKVEEGVTEDDIYNEYLNPENKNKHAEQYRLRESLKDKETSVDPELFFEWLNTEDVKIFMSQFGLDQTIESNIEDFKQTLRVFSSIVLDGVDPTSGVIDNIKINILKSHPNNSGFYEWVPNDSGSILFYCFESSSNKYVVPIAKSNNVLRGVVKSKKIAKRLTNVIPISSKGRIQKRIKDVCGDKIPSWQTLGIFVGDKTGFSHIRNMGWGKAFVPLTTWSEWFDGFGENFFRVQDINESTKWAWRGYNEDPTQQGIAVGVQKSIDFATFLDLCKHVRIVKRRAGNKDLRQESANVLSKFFGVTVDPTQYSTSLNRDEAAEKNAQEIKNSEISILWKARVSSLITSMIRYFDGEESSIKTKFFERLIKLAPENTSGEYKSGFTITLPVKSGAENIEFFLENTKDGFVVSKYNLTTGKYDSTGVTINNFSKLQDDGSGLGIINIYSLIKELVSKYEIPAVDLIDVEGISIYDLKNLEGDELKLAAEVLFKSDAIRFGIKTRYTNSEGESKYYVPNEAFIVGDLLEGDTPFDSHVLSKLSKFIDSETVFKHGIYCNIRSDHQLDNNNEWKYRNVDTEEEQENYVWDIIDVKLPLYKVEEPEDPSTGSWGQFLSQFSKTELNTIDGILDDYSFEKEDVWLVPIKNGERSQIDISHEVGTNILELLPVKEGWIDGISLDGKSVRITKTDYTLEKFNLKTPIDTSSFKVKSVINAITSVAANGKNYEVILKDGELKFSYQDSTYNAILGFSDGLTVEVTSKINGELISTKVLIEKLPDNLQESVRKTLDEFGQMIGKHTDFGSEIYFFKKDNVYYMYNSGENINQECTISRMGDQYYVFDASGTMLLDQISIKNMSEFVDTRATLTDGSYLETSDNLKYKVVGNLRMPSLVLYSISNSDNVSVNEFDVTEIDLQNKIIRGSFGELVLNDNFVIDDLRLGSDSIKIINGSDTQELIKKLQENPTLKRVLGEIPNIESDSSDEIVGALNSILKEMRFDIGKWWNIEYKNNRVSVNSRRDSETLIGKELKELGISDISDIEIVSGKEGWKYKEIVVTLSDGSKQFLELTKNRRSDRWDVKVKDIETSSKEGILETSELSSMLNNIKALTLPDGTSLIKDTWISALEAKIDSIVSGKDVDDLYNNFVMEFSNYMLSETNAPNYQQTIETISPLLMSLTEADATKTCKV